MQNKSSRNNRIDDYQTLSLVTNELKVVIFHNIQHNRIPLYDFYIIILTVTLRLL